MLRGPAGQSATTRSTGTIAVQACWPCILYLSALLLAKLQPGGTSQLRELPGRRCQAGVAAGGHVTMGGCVCHRAELAPAPSVAQAEKPSHDCAVGSLILEGRRGWQREEGNVFRILVGNPYCICTHHMITQAQPRLTWGFKRAQRSTLVLAMCKLRQPKEQGIEPGSQPGDSPHSPDVTKIRKQNRTSALSVCSLRHLSHRRPIPQ